MNLSRLDLAKEVYHKLKETYPTLSLKMTDAILREFLHSLGEKVLKEGHTAQLRPYGTITRKTRKKRDGSLIEYVHLKAGKSFRRERP